ncbi:MAG: AAA family ATPase [Bacteroidota bacterium]
MAILSFGAKNFYSFKEGFEVSFELNDNCPSEISQGKDYATVLCVKGANASGKTNILKALYFINTFGERSFSNDPSHNIPIESFYDDENPSEFFMEFRVDDITYRYELEVTKKEVIRETLLRKIKRFSKVIERKQNSFTELVNEFQELSDMKLRKNASFISLAYQYDFNSTRLIYNFFNSVISNIGPYGLYDKRPDIKSISKLYFNNPQMFEFAKSIMKRSDLGINDIEIRKSSYENGDEYYYPMFFHNYSGGIGKIGDIDESSGTKALFIFLAYYYTCLKKRCILIMDEFDINLHPHIQPLLVDLFLDPKSNEFGSQLIFTTHNTDIIDSMTKYRTILVNKEDNESYSYRLDEIGGTLIRNDRPIHTLYNDGKIGGVPRL